MTTCVWNLFVESTSGAVFHCVPNVSTWPEWGDSIGLLTYEFKWSYHPRSYERNFSNCVEKRGNFRKKFQGLQDFNVHNCEDHSFIWFHIRSSIYEALQGGLWCRFVAHFPAHLSPIWLEQEPMGSWLQTSLSFFRCNTIVAVAFSLKYKCSLNVLNFCVL